MRSADPALPFFVPDRPYTLDEWTAIEEATGERFEYWGRHLLSASEMVGASIRHSLLGGNLCYVAGQLERAWTDVAPGRTPCLAFTKGLLVAIREAADYAYPDAMIVRGPVEHDCAEPNAVTNPLVIFEILSEVSEAFDRGYKFERYGEIDTLREYVLVAQAERRVEVFARETSSSPWQSAVYASEAEEVCIPSMEGGLLFKALYRNWDRFEGPAD